MYEPLIEAVANGTIQQYGTKPPRIADIARVCEGVRFVPFGDWEGTPYISFRLKNGESGLLYGHYLEGTVLQRVLQEVQAQLK